MAENKKYSYSELFKRLFKYLRNDGKKFMFAILILIAGNLILAVTPKMVGNILDYLSAYVSRGYVGLNETYLVLYILAIAGLYIIGNGLAVPD